MVKPHSLQAVPIQQTHGSLVLKDFQMPKGARVVGLSVHLAGAFESVSNCPIGWNVTIDNDLSGQADLVAHAKPGGMALNEKAIRNIGFQVVQTQLEDERFRVGGAVTVLLENGKEKTLPLSSASFELIERFHRHRLSLDAQTPP
jgi:hypothetical protein